MMLIQDEMYYSNGGILSSIVDKYSKGMTISEKDENSIVRFLRVLQRFSRKIG